MADHRHGVMVVDPVSGKVEPYLTRPGFERFFGLNDLHFAANGDLYLTDQGQSGLQSPHGRLFRHRADGQLECLLDNVPSPNGLVLTQDEGQVLLAVTRANAVWRVRFLPGGHAVGKSGTFIQLSGGLAGPDGLALAEDGSLAVCHMGLGTVWLFDRLGEPILRIKSPAGILTGNCAFGGPERGPCSSPRPRRPRSSRSSCRYRACRCSASLKHGRLFVPSIDTWPRCP